MPDPRPPKVLIVDDDGDIRRGLRFMLEQLKDFAITEVSDGQAALDVMADTRLDLLILDINLPLVTGEAVLTLVGFDEGFKRPGHIVVMSAASNLADFRSRPDSVVVNSYMAKPLCYWDLQDIVAEVTSRGTLDGLLE